VFLTEEAFVRRLHLEQRRTERSRRPFVLVLLEVGSLLKAGQKLAVCERIAEVLSISIRETDIRGWYEKGSAIGVIFTEVDGGGRLDRERPGHQIDRLLSSKLTAHQVGQITLSFYVLSRGLGQKEVKTGDVKNGSAAAILYQDSVRAKKGSQVIKRCVDIGWEPLRNHPWSAPVSGDRSLDQADVERGRFSFGRNEWVNTAASSRS